MTVALTEATLEAGYGAIFDAVTRAAHRACLEHARLTRDDGWPSVETCLAFARLYGITGASLAAFFGHIGWAEGGRTVWLDALRGNASAAVARLRMTDAQALAFGFQCAFADSFLAEGRA